MTNQSSNKHSYNSDCVVHKHHFPKREDLGLLEKMAYSRSEAGSIRDQAGLR